MPKFIIKLTDKKKKKDYYLEWSTLVDSATSGAMSFEEAKALLAKIFSRNQLRKVLSDLNLRGVSTPFYTLQDCLYTNSDGCRSYDEMIKQYCK